MGWLQNTTVCSFLCLTWKFLYLTPQVFAGNTEKPERLVYSISEIITRESECGFPQQLAELRKLVENSGLPNVRLDDYFLARNLRGKKYNIENAQKAIESYRGGIDTIEKQINGLCPADFKEIYDMKILRVLTSKFQHTSVIVVQFENWNLARVSVQQLENAFTFVFEEILDDVETQVNGITGIVDLEGFSGAHAGAALREINQILTVVFSHFPIRLHGIHVVNSGRIFQFCYRGIKAFLPKIVKERLTFYGLQAQLADVIGADILPKQLNGELEEDVAYSNILDKIVINNKPHSWYWNPDVWNNSAL